MFESTLIKHWYVVKTNSNAEFKVAERLSQLNIDAFVPAVQTIRIWSDRKKKVTLPLIPSTVFVNLNSACISQIYPVYGVNGVLKYLGKPAIVRNWEIENLRILSGELNGQLVETGIENFEVGEQVHVVRGPFKGLYGNLVETNGKYRILIALDCLGVSFTVSVPKSCVTKGEKKSRKGD